MSVRPVRRSGKKPAPLPEDRPLMGTRRIVIDGGEVMELVTVLRDPETPEERKEIQDVFKNNIPNVRMRLVKKDCPKCQGKAFIEVAHDPQHPRLTESHECGCVWE
jgi:hypothetical protein